MIYKFDDFYIRKPEPSDIEELYNFKNNPKLISLLGGFSTGYSKEEINNWIEFHNNKKDEIIWVIIANSSDKCIGHFGFYNIDYRVQSAEYAIMIGGEEKWGKGIGKKCTQFILEYGFSELHLNRIYLNVLSTNERAINLYKSMGFKQEGKLDQAQYKNGSFIDVILFRLLRSEYYKK